MNLKIMQISMMAVLAGVAIFASGCKPGGGGGSSELTDYQVAQRDLIQTIQKVQADLAAKKKVTKWEISAKEIQADPKIKELKLDDEMGLQRIQGAISTDIEDLPPLKDFSGYKLVDLDKPDEALKKYSTNKQPPAGNPNTPTQGYELLVDQLKRSKYVLMDLKVTQTMPAQPTEAGKPAKPPETKTQDFLLGPIDETEAKKLIEQAQKAGTKVETKNTYPVKIYIGPKGKLAFGVEGNVDASKLQPPRGPNYYPLDPDTLKKLDDARAKESTLPFMQPKPFDLAIINYKKK